MTDVQHVYSITGRTVDFGDDLGSDYIFVDGTTNSMGKVRSFQQKRSK